jgi:hypothetical protein
MMRDDRCDKSSDIPYESFCRAFTLDRSHHQSRFRSLGLILSIDNDFRSLNLFFVDLEWIHANLKARLGDSLV